MHVSRVLFAAVAGSVLILTPVPAGTAAPAPSVGPHRHFLVTPQGQQPVGPQVCENSNLQAAFNQFHWGIHVGPANDAFDHQHNPVNIIGGPC